MAPYWQKYVEDVAWVFDDVFPWPHTLDEYLVFHVLHFLSFYSKMMDQVFA